MRRPHVVRIRPLVLAVVLLLWSRAAAFAEDPKVGVLLGYPTAFGLIWQVSERVALRPDLTFSFASGESSLSTSDNTAVGVGLSGLFYTHRWDNARVYLSPRVTYSHSTTSSGPVAPNSPGVTVSSIDGRNSVYSVSGSVGAEYHLHRHVGLFGETGFAYSHSQTTSTSSITFSPIQLGAAIPSPPPSLSSSTSTSRTWGPRASAGVILYF